MSALDELSVQCERRGWRVALTGYPRRGTAGLRREAGVVVDGLEVRGVRIGGSRELLARVAVDGKMDDLAFYPALEGAALDAAHALAGQGLIGA